MPARSVTRRKILFFALVFLPVFVLCLWLYPRAQPVYQKAVVGAIDVALHRLEPPMRIEISEDGGWTTHILQPDGTERFYWSRPGKNLTLFFLGLALLPALLIATPVSMRGRVGLLGAGLLLLYALHVLAGVGLVLSIRCLANDPGVLVCKWAKTVGNTFGQVTAFVVWGALTWQVWFPRAETRGGVQDSRTIARGELVRNPGFVGTCFVALGLLLVSHAGHFSNGFHYADHDTIVDNLSIRSLGNTGKFFTDPQTFSTLPTNAVYRPLLTLSHALDSWAGSGIRARQFHHTQFALLFAAGFICALLFKRLYDLGRTAPENRYVALFAALLLCLHVTSTAVIDDFTARPELLAALCVAASFWIYLVWPAQRRWYLYLLPMFVGSLGAPATLAFGPLLVAFAWFFEEQRALRDLLRSSEWPRLGAVLRRCAPALLLGLAMFVFLRTMGGAATGVDGGGWKQLVHLPYVWLHHARLFLLPIGLTADPAWSYPHTGMLLPALAGFVFLIALLVAIDRLSRVASLRPAALGLSWFAIAVLASSSLRTPGESQVARPFFLAYVGLACASVWLAVSVLRRLNEGGKPAAHWVAAAVAMVLLAASALATRERHVVWKSDETLWADAVRKNPQSARGRMNYGRALSALGRHDEALEHLELARAGSVASPMLELELARVAAAAGRNEDAETHYAQALELEPQDPRNRYAFARWLAGRGRGLEAIEHLTLVVGLGTSDVNVRRFLMNLYAASGNETELQAVAQATLEILSTEFVARAYGNGRVPIWAARESAKAYQDLARQELDARRWVSAALLLRQVVAFDSNRPRILHRLGWAQTQLGFHEGAETNYRRALAILPNSAPLWNDLGWALLEQQRFDAAVESFETALRIDPGHSRARGNLAWTRRQAAEQAAEAPVE